MNYSTTQIEQLKIIYLEAYKLYPVCFVSHNERKIDLNQSNRKEYVKKLKQTKYAVNVH